MKLTETKINVETGGVVQETMFGVSDLGMIFDILRNKLYSNPIGSLCREYAVNARDAHVEMGKQNVPVKIVLPSSLDPHWRVSDKGPGISPDRMKNVCIQYAASTKRDSNDQVGGFGIGMKSGWAYSDTFNITTVVDGIRYLYCCYIDESKVGKLALLEEISTDESNGTQICIPVRKQDFQEFVKATEEAVRWWDVPVEVVGDFHHSKRMPKEHIIMSGTDWDVYRGQASYYDSSEICILIDGIMYGMKSEMIDKYRYKNQNDDLAHIFKGNKELFIRFPNGVVSLGANREAIHWDDKTKKVIFQKLEEISKEIVSKIQAEINSASNYIEACVKSKNFSKAFNLYSEGFMWNGLKIETIFRGKSSKDGKSAFSYTLSKENTGNNAVVNLKKVRDNCYEVSDSTMIVVNDVGLINVSAKRAVQVLDLVANTGINSLHIFHESTWKEFELYHKHLPHFLLSTIIGKKSKDGSDKVRKARRLIYCFNSISNKFLLSSVEDFESQKDLEKVYVLLDRNFDNVMYHHSLDKEMFHYVNKHNKVIIYGFDKTLFNMDPDNYSDFTDEAVDLVEYVKSNILSKFSIEEICSSAKLDTYSNALRSFEIIKKIYLLVNDKMCIQKYIELVNTTNENYSLYKAYGSLIKEIYPDLNSTNGTDGFNKIKTAFDEIINRYPLCELLFERGIYAQDKEISKFADYINLIDSHSGVDKVNTNDNNNYGSL